MAESIQLIFTPDFQTQLRRLTKRYRQIRQDIQPRADRIRVRAIILVSEEEDFDDIRSRACAKDSIKN
jgi:mRNA-degrading endonuclease RelE of RelBE toxin-antitoxin system